MINSKDFLKVSLVQATLVKEISRHEWVNPFINPYPAGG